MISNQKRGVKVMAEKKYLIDNTELMAEWNWERNKDITPSQLTLGSNKKVWWKCVLGHEWEAIVSSRNRGNGCPVCKKELQTSFPEQTIYFYVKQISTYTGGIHDV